MYNTPNSRTSKHGSSKKSQQRANRQPKSRSATPVKTTILPEFAPVMDAPVETTMEGYTQDFTDAEVTEGMLEAEGRGYVEEAPEVEVGRSGGLSVPPPLSEPLPDPVHLSFDPFSDIEDTETDGLPRPPQFEPHEEETIPADVSFAPATVPDTEHDAQPIERAEHAFGALSDIIEPAQETEMDEQHEPPVIEQERDVTRRESTATSPPNDSNRTRAPILVSRNFSSPSTLSRQLQGVHPYLPSSPQLPSLGFSNPLANFAAPRISNVTVSGSGFNTASAHTTADPFVTPKEARRRSTGNFGERDRDRDRARLKMTPQAPKLDDSDEEENVHPSTPMKRTSRYPSTSRRSDKVVFSTFAAVSLSATSPPRRLLFIGYENGLQIWDTTHLGEVQEVLNRRLSGAVVGCVVLPSPHPSVEESPGDAYDDRRPLIGIVVEEHESCYLLVYSLATHEVIKKLDFSGASVSSFQASSSFIVVSTSSPTSLHILCARTLNILHTFQSRQLATFSRPVSSTTPHGHTEIFYTARQDRPHAVFALSSRLLAFASVSPTADTSPLKHIYPRMAIPQSPSIQLGPLNVSQADIGNAAMKVGGGLLSGMKVLGGMAVAAARGESMATNSTDISGGFRKFFSRSAPATTTPARHERKSSSTPSVFGHPDSPEAERSGRASEPSSSSPDATHITILDLQPLLEKRESGRPERLCDFTLPSGQIVSSFKFSDDGTRLAVVPSDGDIVRLYHIKPRARALRPSALGNAVQSSKDRQSAAPVRRDSAGSFDSYSGLASSTTDLDTSNVPSHVYDLRRGRTSGTIESVDYSVDGRWVGVVTRKRTIHVFATNPYGGKPDEASHMEGRVKNVNELQPLSTEVRPIVRLRSSPVNSVEQLAVPLTTCFISASSLSLPAKFLPSTAAFSPPSIPSSLPSSSPRKRPHSVSPRLPNRPTNYQDILVFDPSESKLFLRRLTVSTRVGDTASSLLSALPIPAAKSISLPGMGFMGGPSASPPKAGAAISTPAASAEQLPTELVAKDSVVATWNLARDSKWSDVKVPLVNERAGRRPQHCVVSKSEWLAQAELSTHSRSSLILPGSIYLSHQFSFYAMSEDYHALLRRSHFDIPASKIDVRREVEANVYSTGQGEGFISAGSTPQDVRHPRSSFDEPLASAILSGLDYSGTSPPVIPMLPNGARPGSFKAAIPIRSVAAGLTDGVSESIGRLSRGIKNARSPRLRPRSEGSAPGPVPLEFDEEDEVFPSQGEHAEGDKVCDNDIENDGDTMSNSGEGRDSRSISTPSTNSNAPLIGSESEAEGWGAEDMGAIEEAEQFDEISAAGFMDEEQMQVPTSFRISGAGQKTSFGKKTR